MRRTICILLVAGSLGAFTATAEGATAPVLTSVTQTSAGHLKVSWSGRYYSPFVEVAMSAAVDQTGYFTDPNTINQPLDDFENSWESDAFPAGTYYVHVGGIDESCLSCSYLFSSVRSIKIGAGGGKTPKKPALFSVLSVPSSQRIGKLHVRAGMVTPGWIIAGGTVSVSGQARLYRFKTVSAPSPSTPGASVKLRLKLPGKALKAVTRALRHGKKLRAKLKIVARPASGSPDSVRRTVSLKR
jgi:hypothetical protein